MSFELEGDFKVQYRIKHESLILAQDERWRRAKHMQVERGGGSLLPNPSGGRVSNA